MSSRLPLGWRVRATVAVVVVPPLLYTMSFSRLARWLGRTGSARAAVVFDDDALAGWVDELLRRLPGLWRHTCLKRATVLYYLLRRAGRPVELLIGVHKKGEAPLGAHAWLVRGGAPYLEPRPDHPHRHTVIARFPEIGGAAV